MYDINPRVFIDTCLVAFVAGLVGARIAAILFDGHLSDFIHLCTDSTLVDAPNTAVRFCRSDADCGAYLCNQDIRDQVLEGARQTMCYPPKDCLAVFSLWSGGLTFYGGLLFGIAATFSMTRLKSISFLRILDCLAPLTMLALAFGRVGCFLGGCCYGEKTDIPLGVHFPGHPGLRHPTQLYECLIVLCIAVVLWPRSKRQGHAGQRAGAMLALYGAFRFMLEYLRDDPRGAFGLFSTSQWIALPLIAIGIYLVVQGRRVLN